MAAQPPRTVSSDGQPEAGGILGDLRKRAVAAVSNVIKAHSLNASLCFVLLNTSYLMISSRHHPEETLHDGSPTTMYYIEMNSG